jgi:hypothetical protein
MSCINFLQAQVNVEVASLIHDGVLIEKKYVRKIDLATLTEHVRATTGLDCSFSIKDMAPEEEDLKWKADVLEAYAEVQAEKQRIRESRDDFTKMMAEAALKIGCTSVIAKMFYSLFPDRFVYLGKGDGCGWFVFKAPRWKHVSQNTEMFYNLLNGEFTERFEDAIIKLEEEEIPDFSLINTLKVILNKQLGKDVFKDGVIKELKALYSDAIDVEEWLNNLNTKKNLLGFEDCVYDFGDAMTHVPGFVPGFREGRPEDMITMNVGHTREQVENCNKAFQEEIVNALYSMHAKDVADYIMQTLATSVVGYRKRQKFQVWTGSGANGKGLTKNVVQAAFGKYYYEPDSKMFTNISVSGSSGPNSELAKLEGKRIVMTSETEQVPNNKLKIGLLKNCTGNDMIQARCLYRKAGEFKCVANIFMSFNEVPGNDDNSGGLARRLEFVDFIKKYVDNPDP